MGKMTAARVDHIATWLRELTDNCELFIKMAEEMRDEVSEEDGTPRKCPHCGSNRPQEHLGLDFDDLCQLADNCELLIEMAEEMRDEVGQQHMVARRAGEPTKLRQDDIGAYSSSREA